jgi:hypothetical protein
MKTINLLMALPVALIIVTACQKEPSSHDMDNEYLVYTAPSKDADLSRYLTFDIADSVLVIGQTDKPYYSQSKNALALIQAFKTNMEDRGYVYTPSNPDAELGIQVTYIVKTERYIQYNNNPYWWMDYPGYWPAGYWGDWTGWYYPYPVTYTYTTNALIADMVDLTPVVTADESKPLTIVWSSYIGGPASPSIYADVQRMRVAINQAFKQSPYLKRAE